MGTFRISRGFLRQSRRILTSARWKRVRSLVQTSATSKRLRTLPFSVESLKRNAGNMAADSRGSLLTITIDDWSIRAVLFSGSRVRNWGRIELDMGIVGDGMVLEPARFKAALSELVDGFYPGSTIRGREVAIAIGGRTHVHARFTVELGTDDNLEEAVAAAALERFSVEAGELVLDWHERPPQVEDDDSDEFVIDYEDDDPSHEIYAVGMYRNVLDADLKAFRDLDSWPTDARPRAMALAAAANEEEAIILDLEPFNFSVSVLRDGLPEVARDMWIDAETHLDQLVQLAAEQVKTTVGYFDSINPNGKLLSNVPIIVVGTLTDNESLVAGILNQLPYPAAELPELHSAPTEFNASEYAPNIGLGILSGRKAWKGRRDVDIPKPTREFTPSDFPMRPRPVRAIAAGLAVATLILGAGLGLQEVQNVHAETQERFEFAKRLEQLVNERRSDLRQAGILQAGIDQFNSEADAIFASTSAISGIDRGFSGALSEVILLLPRGVILREFDDDGALVVVDVAASSTAGLLSYAEALESSPGFDRVRLRSLSRVGDSRSPTPSAPSGIPGLSDLSGILGGDFGEFGAPPEIPRGEVLADRSLANFFVLSIHLSRKPWAPLPVPPVETVSAAP
ncbi:MAG: hypothetical protein HQ478_03550 [Chloroflexi bacterium]|nr:hypothetical protein [Chloroflexota bacterium]